MWLKRFITALIVEYPLKYIYRNKGCRVCVKVSPVNGVWFCEKLSASCYYIYNKLLIFILYICN